MTLTNNSKHFRFFTKINSRVKNYEKGSLKRKRKVYYIAYTIVFILAALVAYSYFIVDNRSLVWQADGLTQHLNAVAYLGVKVREVIRAFFATGSVNIPMWDSTIGFGSDILTTLHYYGIGDPLTIFYIFVPAKYAELLFNFLVLFRLFLAGITFSMYCFKVVPHKGRFAILCGAMIYSFTYYAVRAGVTHPFFLNPMIYMPLVLLGVEKILHKERPYLFIGAVFVCATSNYYFLYMIVVLTVLYAAVRFFTVIKENRVKLLFYYLFKFIFFGLLALLLAGVILVPNLQTLLNSNRMTVSYIIEPFYNLSYYIKLPYLSFSNRSAANWGYLGASCLCFISVVVLFMQKKKKYRQMKFLFLVLTLILLSPYLGSAMNGFSYVANRWIWGFNFLFALVAVIMLPKLSKLTLKQCMALIVFCLLYAVGSFLSYQNRTGDIFAGMITLLVAVIFILLINFIPRMEKVKIKQLRPYVRAGFVTIILFGIYINSVYCFSPYEGNYISASIRYNDYFNKMSSTPASSVRKIEDNSFHRFEENNRGEQKVIQNTELFNGVNGVSYFYSVVPSNVSQYIYDVQNIGITDEHNNHNLDGRVMLQALASVKYYIVAPQLTYFVPYGYEVKPDYSNKKYTVYQNKYQLPLGYTYDSFITRETYNRLSVTQKQQAMLQSVVLGNATLVGENKNLKFNEKEIPYKIKCSEEARFENGKLIIEDTEATVTLTFQGEKDCETYLHFQNLHYKGISPLSKVSAEEFEALSPLEKSVLEKKERYWQESNTIRITAESGDFTSKFVLKTPKQLYYRNQHNYLVNMGYKKDVQKEIVLTFDKAGTYTFDNLNVVCQPMDNYTKQVEKLRENTLQNEKVETNKISGTISLEKEKLLVLSVPYSEGWTAFVDGQKVDLLEANLMYMALPLQAGDHTIELYYFTPWLKEGMFSTAGALVVLAVIIFFTERQRKRREK